MQRFGKQKSHQIMKKGIYVQTNLNIKEVANYLKESAKFDDTLMIYRFGNNPSVYKLWLKLSGTQFKTTMCKIICIYVCMYT